MRERWLPLVCVLVLCVLGFDGVSRANEAQRAEAVRQPAREMWEGLVDAEPFLREQPVGRVLVWAEPGEHGSGFEAGNWLEDGEPADAPPDEQTTIVLPPSPDGEPYVVGVGGPNAEPFVIRHAWIGDLAALDAGYNTGRYGWSLVGGWDNAIHLYGNLMTEGTGYVYGHLHFAGPGDAFIRIDPDCPEPWVRSMHIDKSDGGSLTVLARDWGTAMGGIAVQRGTLVVGPDSELLFNIGIEPRMSASLPGANNNKLRRDSNLNPMRNFVHVHEAGGLTLRSGASIHKARPHDRLVPDFRIEGTFRAGMPQFPLERSATVGLTLAEGPSGFLRQPGGFYLQRHGQFEVESADPAQARLVFDSFEDGEAEGEQRGIAVYFEKPVELQHVRFHRLRQGGLVMPGIEEALSRWEAVTFAEDNAGARASLLAPLPEASFEGGPGTVTFVDGESTRCEILLEHAGRLVVRALDHSHAQSFDLATVHAVGVEGQPRRELNPRRELTDAERAARAAGPLWGNEVEEGRLGRYAEQAWEQGRLLIWREPGTSGSGLLGANWIDERGLPVFDTMAERPENTDLLLPAAAQAYEVFGVPSAGDGEPTRRLRHLTVEANAFYNIAYWIGGNLWVKRGGNLRGWQIGGLGSGDADESHHTFARFESKIGLGHWCQIDTGEQGSLEVIGPCRGPADRVTLQRGTLIISRDSWLGDGVRSSFYTQPETTLILLQNAVAGSHRAYSSNHRYATLGIGGTLMIGTPEMPITADMTLPLQVYPRDNIEPGASPSERTSGASLVIGETGRLEVHNADPANITVTFTRREPGEEEKGWKEHKNAPDGLAAVMRGEVHLKGVEFNGFYEGGIIVEPEQRADWEHIRFGPDNFAEPEQLFRAP